MKKLISLIILTISLSIYGQSKNLPTIVVLSSQKTIIPASLDSVARSFIRKGLPKKAKESIRKENGKFKLKAEKEIEFLEETDITTNIS